MAYNSIIKQKKCKCGTCDKYPRIGYNGYCSVKCMPEDVQQMGKWKNKAIHKRNKAVLSTISRNVYKHLENSVSAEKTAVISPQMQWFLDRRKEMTGFCVCGCGLRSSKNDGKYFHCSVGHILQKAKVKSMALHPLNWVELNFWDGCHSNFDNRSSDLWEGMACWDEIVSKFKAMYPLIPDYEKRYIPQVLLNQL